MVQLRAEDNSLVAEYIYSGYGEILSIKDASGNEITDQNHIANVNPIRYRGYYYDAETGFYYLRSRYYDPITCRFISPDSQLNGGLLGYNLFAYCENNPIGRVDANGNMAAEVGVAVSNWWNPVGWIAAAFLVVEVVIVATAVYEVVEETAEVIKEAVEAIDNIVEIRDQSVYILTDPNDGGKVKYVGRTNDPERRMKEHKKHPLKAGYEMTVVSTGLSIEEAKVTEQTLISTYTLDYLDNARREIAAKNLPAYNSYMGSVLQIVAGIHAEALMELLGR